MQQNAIHELIATWREANTILLPTLVNVLNNRVYGIYCNVITVHNENTHRLWGYGSVGQLLNIVLVTLRRAGY